MVEKLLPPQHLDTLLTTTLGPEHNRTPTQRNSVEKSCSQFENNIVRSFWEVQKINNYCTFTQSHLLFGGNFYWGVSQRLTRPSKKKKRDIIKEKQRKTRNALKMLQAKKVWVKDIFIGCLAELGHSKNSFDGPKRHAKV